MQNYESDQTDNLSSSLTEKDVAASESLPITPNNPPWNSWAAVGVWFASIALIVVFPNVLLLPYLAKQSLDFSDRAAIIEFAKSDPTAVLLQLIAIIPAHIFTLVLAWLVVTRFRNFSFRQTLGWQWNGFNFWKCSLILVGIFVVTFIVSYFIPEQDNDLLRILKSSRNAVYLVAFLATFTAPLVEEVVYRGILYSAFQRSAGVLTGILITTFLFALVHVPQYWGSPGTIILICLLSLVLTLVRYRTKNLLPCIVLHTLFNGIQSLMLLLQPYFESDTAKSQTASIVHFLIKYI